MEKGEYKCEGTLGNIYRELDRMAEYFSWAKAPVPVSRRSRKPRSRYQDIALI